MVGEIAMWIPLIILASFTVGTVLSLVDFIWKAERSTIAKLLSERADGRKAMNREAGRAQE